MMRIRGGRASVILKLRNLQGTMKNVIFILAVNIFIILTLDILMTKTSHLSYVKMPTVVGILTFVSRIILSQLS